VNDMQSAVSFRGTVAISLPNERVLTLLI
jgi:hypothetical protein